jgi:hypothetical protein
VPHVLTNLSTCVWCAQVIAHLGRVPGSGSAGHYGLRLAYDNFDWSLVHATGRAVGQSTGPGGLPKLIGLSDELASQLSAASTSWADWQKALMGLAQAAAVSGRIPVGGVGVAKGVAALLNCKLKADNVRIWYLVICS